jgi:hypothetical protein
VIWLRANRLGKAAAKAYPCGNCFAKKATDMLRAVFLALGLAAPLIAGPLAAQTQIVQPDIAQLSKLLDISGLIEVMRSEGQQSAEGVDADLLQGQGGTAWLQAVARVYDPARLHARFDASLARQLADDPATRKAMAGFFGSHLGQRIVGLEISARRTLLDDAAETAAKAAWAKVSTTKSRRVSQIEHFAQINDLIESNVTGALNSNLAFFRGLSAGGAFEDPMPESDMLAEVWAQEGDIRADTADWVYPFLMLAYQPLSDKDFDKYIAFSETPAGTKANAAIFAAFDEMFVELSQDLGREAARLMQGEDI